MSRNNDGCCHDEKKDIEEKEEKERKRYEERD